MSLFRDQQSAASDDVNHSADFDTLDCEGWLDASNSFGTGKAPEEDRSDSSTETEDDLDDESWYEDSDSETDDDGSLSDVDAAEDAASSEAGAHADVNFLIRFGFSPPGWQRAGAQKEADKHRSGEDDSSCFSSSSDEVEEKGMAKDKEHDRQSFEIGERANVNFLIQFGFSPLGWQRSGAQEEADGNHSGKDDDSCSSSCASSCDGSDLGMLEDEEAADDEKEVVNVHDSEKVKEDQVAAKEEEEEGQFSEAGVHSNVNFVMRFGFSPPGWQRPGSREEADGGQSGEDDFSCSSSCASSCDASDLEMLEEKDDEEDEKRTAKAKDDQKVKEEEDTAKDGEEDEH